MQTKQTKPPRANRNDAQMFTFGEFKPISTLWDGEGATHPSEYSARWTIRKMQTQLAEAGALAVHRGRLFIHPEKFAVILEAAAIESARVRVAGGREPVSRRSVSSGNQWDEIDQFEADEADRRDAAEIVGARDRGVSGVE